MVWNFPISSSRILGGNDQRGSMRTFYLWCFPYKTFNILQNGFLCCETCPKTHKGFARKNGHHYTQGDILRQNSLSSLCMTYRTVHTWFPIHIWVCSLTRKFHSGLQVFFVCSWLVVKVFVPRMGCFGLRIIAKCGRILKGKWNQINTRRIFSKFDFRLWEWFISFSMIS